MMFISSLWRFVLPFPQQLQNLSNREAGSAGARNELAHQLVELPSALHVIALHLLIADERTHALLGLEHFPDFHLAVRSRNSVWVDGKVDRHLADGRELVTAGQ